MEHGRNGLYVRDMYLKRSKNLSLLAAVGASACGSDTDLVIGAQAEAGVTVFQEAGPDTREAAPAICGDGATREASPFDASGDGGCPNATDCTTLKAALVHRY